MGRFRRDIWTADAVFIILEADQPGGSDCRNGQRRRDGIRMEAAGASCGRNLVRPMGGVWNIYELLPAFIVSALAIIIVSLLTKAPSEEMNREFEEVRAGR